MKKTIITTLIILTRLTLIGQSSFFLKHDLVKNYSVCLKNISPKNEDVFEPLIFENQKNLYYTSDKLNINEIKIYTVNKTNFKETILKIKLEPDIAVRINSFALFTDTIVAVSYLNEKITLMQFTANNKSKTYKLNKYEYLKFGHNNKNLIINKRKIILTSFYYNKQFFPFENLNIYEYDICNLKALDSFNIKYGLSAFSSIEPQKYFYLNSKNHINFLNPSDGKILEFNKIKKDTLTLSKLKIDGLKLLTKQMCDTLTRYAIKKDIMSTYWKAIDYLIKDTLSYFNFITPINNNNCIVSYNNANQTLFTIVDSNFQQNLYGYEDFLDKVNQLNKTDYFLYYFNQISLNNFASINVLTKRENRKNKYENKSIGKKYYFYTNYSIK